MVDRTREELEVFVEKIITVNSRCAIMDRLVLFAYAHSVPENGVIVDIGTFFGSSAFSMALGSYDSVKVYTVDPTSDPQFFTKRQALGLNDRVEFINKTGEEAGKTWDKPIDLLFIDAIHSYEGVKDDLKWFGTHVKKGGYILAHDFYLYEGIREALNESVQSGFMEKVDVVDTFDEKNITPRFMGIFIGRKL